MRGLAVMPFRYEVARHPERLESLAEKLSAMKELELTKAEALKWVSLGDIYATCARMSKTEKDE